MAKTYNLGTPDSARAGIAAAVAALAAGELVAMPTETVYGLAADATNGLAVARIYEAKGRPRFNPLIVHVADLEAAERIAVFDRRAHRLAARFWPGPLTLVLPGQTDSPVASLATAGLETVAVRVPADPNALALLRAYGRPLAAPSANPSGRVSATSAAHVAADLGDAVAVILDAGPSRIGVELTIIGLAGEPVLLRPGGLSRADLEAVLGVPIRSAASSAAPSAPGMLASHYAPRARLRMAATSVEPGEGLLAFGPLLPEGAPGAGAVVNLSPAGDLTEAAARLFDALRDLDARVGRIAVVPIPEEGLGEAINDRLRRAAAPRPDQPSTSEPLAR